MILKLNISTHTHHHKRQTSKAKQNYSNLNIYFFTQKGNETDNLFFNIFSFADDQSTRLPVGYRNSSMNSRKKKKIEYKKKKMSPSNHIRAYIINLF